MNPTPDTLLTRNSLSLLYDQYSSQLFGFIIRIAGNNELAEAILQQTLLEIFTRMEEMNHTKENRLSWMLNIALQRSLSSLPGGTDGPKENDRSEETNPETISKLIRQVMIDVHFKGLTLEEAAAKQGIPFARLIRGMKKAVNLLPGGPVK